MNASLESKDGYFYMNIDAIDKRNYGKDRYSKNGISYLKK
jgi:hypothetical protein